MLEEVNKLGTYDQIKFTLKDEGWIYRGQFRGKIKDVDHAYYDWCGKAIWVTTDKGFELFTNIEDITSLEVIEKYGK
jgi:hypothetical protein